MNSADYLLRTKLPAGRLTGDRWVMDVQSSEGSTDTGCVLVTKQTGHCLKMCWSVVLVQFVCGHRGSLILEPVQGFRWFHLGQLRLIGLVVRQRCWKKRSSEFYKVPK